MKNSQSLFPEIIDDRIYFSDIRLEDIPTLQQYQLLLSQNKYTEASELLNNSDVFFYGAWIVNLLENRLHNIGNYIVNEMSKGNNNYYQTDEPNSDESNVVWVY